MFALVAAVSLCIEMRNTRIGWSVTLLYTGYMASIITFRSLLCVNLGTSCSDPIGYSWNLIFISAQVLILLFGFPVIMFLRHRFT